MNTNGQSVHVTSEESIYIRAKAPRGVYLVSPSTASGAGSGDGMYAELWLADVRTGARRTLYAEESRHIYGGCISPDGEYALFTRSVADLGKVDDSGTTISIIRMRDTPMLGASTPALHARFPGAKTGPRLDLAEGWEPHWTSARITFTPTSARNTP